MQDFLLAEDQCLTTAARPIVESLLPDSGEMPNEGRTDSHPPEDSNSVKPTKMEGYPVDVKGHDLYNCKKHMDIEVEFKCVDGSSIDVEGNMNKVIEIIPENGPCPINWDIENNNVSQNSDSFKSKVTNLDCGYRGENVNKIQTKLEKVERKTVCDTDLSCGDLVSHDCELKPGCEMENVLKLDINDEHKNFISINDLKKIKKEEMSDNIRSMESYTKNAQCQYCPEIVAKTMLRVHFFETHLTQENARCKLCNADIQKQSFFDHFAQHYTVKCPLCAYELNISNPEQHIKDVHAADLFCPICKMTFSHEDECISHIVTHMASTEPKCPICLCYVSEKDHACAINAISSTWGCSICTDDRLFHYQGALRHVSRHLNAGQNKSDKMPENDQNKTMDLLECVKCHMKLASVKTMKRHLFKEHIVMDSAVCDICYTPVDGQDLVKHIDQHLSMKCPVCSVENIPSFSKLQEHVQKAHFSDKVCGVCSKTFENGFDLTGHIVVHQYSTDKRLCPTCNGYYIFHRNATSQNTYGCHFVDHVLTEISWSCTICSKPLDGYKMAKEHAATHLQLWSGQGGSSISTNTDQLKVPSQRSKPTKRKRHSKSNGTQVGGSLPSNADPTKVTSQKGLKKKRKKVSKSNDGIVANGNISKDEMAVQEVFEKTKDTLRHLDEGQNIVQTDKGNTMPENCQNKPVDLWECVQCKMKLASEGVLKRHLFEQHMVMDKALCVICNTQVASENLVDHIDTHLTMKCPACPVENIPSFSKLQEHVENAHSSDKLCVLCSRTFENGCDLIGHIIGHQYSNDRRLCPTCDGYFVFHRNSILRNKYGCHFVGHMLSDISWSCTICSKSLVGCISAKEHVSSHLYLWSAQIGISIPIIVEQNRTPRRRRRVNKSSNILVHYENLANGEMPKDEMPIPEVFGKAKVSRTESKTKVPKVEAPNTKVHRIKPNAKVPKIEPKNEVPIIEPKEPNPWRCQHCAKKVASKDMLKEHMFEDHMTEVSAKCVICDENVTEDGTLYDHIETHLTFKCPLCEVDGLSTFDQLKLHVEDAHSEDLFCHLCNKTYESLGAFQDHIVEHQVNNDRRKCAVCFKYALFRKRGSRLIPHHFVSHMVTKSSLKCNICFKRLSGKPPAMEHIRSHLGTSRPKLIDKDPEEYRKKKFRRKKRKNLELAKEIPTDEMTIEIWECPYCATKLTSRQMLKMHMFEEHIVQECAQCVICEAKVEENETMFSHLAQHLTMRCPICNLENIPTIADLKLHVENAHTSNMSCPFCVVKFESVEDFADHIVDHQKSNDRRKCPTCSHYNVLPGKHFVQHMVTKSTWKCGICLTRITKYRAAQDHMKLAHLIKCPSYTQKLKQIQGEHNYMGHRESLVTCEECTGKLQNCSKCYFSTKSKSQRLALQKLCKRFCKKQVKVMLKRGEISCVRCGALFVNPNGVTSLVCWECNRKQIFHEMEQSYPRLGYEMEQLENSELVRGNVVSQLSWSAPYYPVPTLGNEMGQSYSTLDTLLCDNTG